MKTNIGRTPFKVLAVIAVLVAAAQPEAWARGGFKGGGFKSSSAFKSSGSSRSFKTTTSKSTSTAFKGWGSAVKPSSPSSSTSSRLTTTTTSGLGRSTYQSSKGVYDNARRNGTLFSSKTEAQSAFKDRYASQYGSKYASEPSSRPEWIPQYTTVGGRNVNIVYNPGLGGYGYMDAMGRWILYDALADAVMANTLMNRHNYYYGPPVYASHSFSFLYFAMVLLFIAITAVVMIRVFRRRSRWE